MDMMAQVKPTRVESPIVMEKDFVWYVEQKNEWRDITQKEPQNETAWLNYYNAARYMGWFGQPSDSLARQAMKEMREAIPNTYTYNMCAYMSVKMGMSDETDGDPYAEAALTMLPDEMQLNDYNEWVCYLAMKGQEQRMTQMAKRYFDSGLYSETVLRYSYNELAGMDEGGIYLSSGDAAIIPKWLIQEGMGLHKDKTVVCVPFLAVREYREWLSRKLDIVFPTLESGNYTSYDAFEQSLLQAIIDRIEKGTLDASIELVVSSRMDAYGLERAKKHGLQTLTISKELYAEPLVADEVIAAELKMHNVDYVIMAGYMRMVHYPILAAYPNRVVNLHPALLPSFKGAHAIQDAYDYGVKVTGVTVHFANSEYDCGPIIAQQALPVEECWTVDELEEHIHAIEHQLYPDTIQLLAEGRVRVRDNRTVEVLGR
jgi:phosphoribosylglycinamide formyltransferase-1